MNLLFTRQQLIQSLNRFPASFLSCFLYCLCGIYNNHVEGLFDAEFLLVTFFLSSVLFTVSQLFVESIGRSSPYFRFVVPFLILIAMAINLYISPMVRHWHALFFALALVAFLPVAPFTKNTASPDKIFRFSFALGRQMLFALIVSAIIFAGLVAIALTISILFDTKYRVIPDFLFIIASLLFSTLTLSGIPHDFEREELAFGAHFVHVLIGYLVIPLLMFYGGILYWYFIALCITQTLPKGVIVYMTGGFGFFGIIVYLALDHTQALKMATIDIFKKYYFRILPVPLFLMALAIGIRTFEYGLSGPRYVVVMGTLWLLLVTLFSFSSNKKKLSYFVYMSASSFALLTALTIGLTLMNRS